MRHVTRTHRVALDWLFDRINLDTKIQIKYMDTKNQLADILTKGNFTRVCSTLAISDLPIVLKWFEKIAKRCRWRASHSKIETDDEFGLAMQRKESWRACLYCIRKPGENQIWKSNTSELVDWAASKNGETWKRRLLIKLLRVECWRKMVFSWVEIWWSDGSKNGETCKWTTTRFVHTAHGQIYCWWRWYGL